MQENVKKAIEDSLNSGNEVIVDAKANLEQLDTHYNCTHQRKKIQDNGFYYCTDCGSKINENMPKKY